MRLPTKCRIGCQNYTIAPLSEEDHEKHSADGLCSVGSAEIFVSMDPRINERTVASSSTRIFHGVCDAYGLSLSHDLEERVVNTLSPGLAQVIQDNPKVIDWIIERLNS